MQKTREEAAWWNMARVCRTRTMTHAYTRHGGPKCIHKEWELKKHAESCMLTNVTPCMGRIDPIHLAQCTSAPFLPFFLPFLPFSLSFLPFLLLFPFSSSLPHLSLPPLLFLPSSSPDHLCPSFLLPYLSTSIFPLSNFFLPSSLPYYPLSSLHINLPTSLPHYLSFFLLTFIPTFLPSSRKARKMFQTYVRMYS